MRDMREKISLFPFIYFLLEHKMPVVCILRDIVASNGNKTGNKSKAHGNIEPKLKLEYNIN